MSGAAQQTPYTSSRAYVTPVTPPLPTRLIKRRLQHQSSTVRSFTPSPDQHQRLSSKAHPFYPHISKCVRLYINPKGQPKRKRVWWCRPADNHGRLCGSLHFYIHNNNNTHTSHLLLCSPFIKVVLCLLGFVTVLWFHYYGAVFFSFCFS